MNEFTRQISNGAADNVVPFPLHLTSRGAALTETPAPRGDQRDVTILDSLIGALTNNTLSVHYQNQYCLRTGKTEGIEALVRLEDGTGKHHDTAEVIDVAERHNLIGVLGKVMFARACRHYSDLRRRGVELGRMAFNVSPLELRRPDFVETISQTLAETGLEFGDVELEITEQHSLRDPALRIEHLHTLVELGMSLAIDDFGAGYSAWTCLMELPVSTLKIDRSLVRPLAQNSRARAIVGHICHAGTDLGMRVVAEGISSNEQRRLLLELGCGIGQGFGLSRPVPAKAVPWQGPAEA